MFDTSSPQSFRNVLINKSIDMDGVPAGQPYQCVDTFKAFTKSALGYSWALGGSGGAKELWLQRGRYSDGFHHVADINALRDGDFVVWNGAGNNPYGHVAMFRAYQNGGLLCLGQNQPVAYHTEAVISRANFLGALRPKKWDAPAPAPTPAPQPQPAPQPAPNSDVKVGSTVRPIKAVDYKGGALAAFVTSRDYPVIELNGDRAVLGNGLNTAFRTGNLKVVAQPTPAPAPAPEPAAPQLPTMGGKVRTTATRDAQNGLNLNLRVINDGESVWTENNSNGFAVLRKGNSVRAAVPIESLERA